MRILGTSPASSNRMDRPHGSLVLRPRKGAPGEYERRFGSLACVDSSMLLFVFRDQLFDNPAVYLDGEIYAYLLSLEEMNIAEDEIGRFSEDHGVPVQVSPGRARGFA